MKKQSVSLSHTHTHCWFYAKGCINMNQGWQWRAEWSPVHPIFIIYLRLNGFGTPLDGSPLTSVCLLKCEKWYSSKLNLTSFHFPPILSLASAPALTTTNSRTLWEEKKMTKKNCRGIITKVICIRADGGGWCAHISLANGVETALTVTKWQKWLKKFFFS